MPAAWETIKTYIVRSYLQAVSREGVPAAGYFANSYLPRLTL